MDGKKPEPVSIGEQFYKCPRCGYEDGFHTSFVRKAEGSCRIILICPACHSRYDPKWNVDM